MEWTALRGSEWILNLAETKQIFQNTEGGEKTHLFTKMKLVNAPSVGG